MTYLHLIFKMCLVETHQTITPAYAPTFFEGAGGFAFRDHYSPLFNDKSIAQCDYFPYYLKYALKYALRNQSG